MIAVFLVLALLGSLGLFVHLISVGEFAQAAKVILPGIGIFVLLSLRVGFHRMSHGR